MDENKEYEKRAILKGGMYAFAFAMILLAISVLCAFLDKLFGL